MIYSDLCLAFNLFDLGLAAQSNHIYQDHVTAVIISIKYSDVWKMYFLLF